MKARLIRTVPEPVDRGTKLTSSYGYSIRRRLASFASERLFGPRSSRAFGAAAAIPVASWVSFNLPIGQIAVNQGLLFPVAYAWTCGVVRLLVARTLEDLAVGVAMVSVATGTAWLLRSGSDSLSGAVLACVVAPLAAFLAGWLNGRGRRRARPSVEAEA